MNPRLAELLARLERAGLALDAEGVRDALWLALRAPGAPPAGAAARGARTLLPAEPDERARPAEPAPLEREQARTRPQSGPRPSASASAFGAPGATRAPATRTARLAAAPHVAGQRALARALAPLRVRVPAPSGTELDLEATLRHVVEEDLWWPVVRPARERWLDLALVVEGSLSMELWREDSLWVRRALARSGAFRSLSSWWLDTRGEVPRLFRHRDDLSSGSRERRPRELLGAAGRSLVWLVSDCTSSAWRGAALRALLHEWSRLAPLALLHVLPERLWEQSALRFADPVRLRAPAAAARNASLCATDEDPWIEPARNGAGALLLPVVPLEPAPLHALARSLAGHGEALAGFRFAVVSEAAEPIAEAAPAGDARVARFRAHASPGARRLAAACAAAPALSLAALRAIRRALFPELGALHEAEVVLGGLLRVAEERRERADPLLAFHAGVRERLLDEATAIDALRVLRLVAAEERGASEGARIVLEVLDQPESSAGLLDPSRDAFGAAAAEVLERLGGAYARGVAGSTTEVPPTREQATEQAEAPVEPVQATAPEAEVAKDVDPDPPRPPQWTWPAPFGHPLPEGEVLGRDRELAELFGWLRGWREGREPIRLLHGPEGIGKSALCGAFLAELLRARADPQAGGPVHSVEDLPPDGAVFYWSFALQRDPLALIEALVEGLGSGRLLAEDDPLEALSRTLEGPPHVIVLDDFEHAASSPRKESLSRRRGRSVADAEQLAEALDSIAARSPGLRLLASTRMPRVWSAARAVTMELGPIDPSAAVALLQTRGLEAPIEELERAAHWTAGVPLHLVEFAEWIRSSGVAWGDLDLSGSAPRSLSELRAELERLAKRAQELDAARELSRRRDELEQHDPKAALQLASEQVHAFERLESPRDLAVALRARGELRFRLHESDRAIEDLSRAAERFGYAQELLERAEVAVRLATVCLHVQRFEDAEASLILAEELFANIGENRRSAETAVHLGHVFARQGNQEGASQAYERAVRTLESAGEHVAAQEARAALERLRGAPTQAAMESLPLVELWFSSHERAWAYQLSRRLTSAEGREPIRVELREAARSDPSDPPRVAVVLASEAGLALLVGLDASGLAKRAQAGEAALVWLRVGRGDVETSFLKGWRPLHDPSVPLEQLSHEEQEQVLDAAAREITELARPMPA